MGLNENPWICWESPVAMPAEAPDQGFFLLGADGHGGWQGYARALGLDLQALDLPAEESERLSWDDKGTWHLQLSYFSGLPQQQWTGESIQYRLGLVMAAMGLWVVVPAAALGGLASDLAEMSTPKNPQEALLRLLLVVIHSHDSTAQGILQRLKVLREALHQAMSNRELSEIAILHRLLGDLVVSLRDLGHTLRVWLWELAEGDPLLPILENAQEELDRIEDGITLIWERHTGITDCYTGIVQNNSHSVMKVMTLWLALLMIPIALIMPFHMNTPLPFGAQHSHIAWYLLLLYAFGVSVVLGIWGRRRGFFEA